MNHYSTRLLLRALENAEKRLAYAERWFHRDPAYNELRRSYRDEIADYKAALVAVREAEGRS